MLQRRKLPRKLFRGMTILLTMTNLFFPWLLKMMKLSGGKQLYFSESCEKNNSWKMSRKKNLKVSMTIKDCQMSTKICTFTWWRGGGRFWWSRRWWRAWTRLCPSDKFLLPSSSGRHTVTILWFIGRRLLRLSQETPFTSRFTDEQLVSILGFPLQVSRWLKLPLQWLVK